MLVLPRRSAKMRRRRRRRIQQVEAATYYLSLGSYYYVLPPSPVRHAYEPVLCIISSPWSMHVCHLNTTPSIPITYMHPTIAPAKSTASKQRVWRTAAVVPRRSILKKKKKKKHVRLIPIIETTNLLAEFHLRRFTLGEPSSDYLQCSIFINEKTNEICRDLTNATRRVFRSVLVFSTWVHSFKSHTFTRDR